MRAQFVELDKEFFIEFHSALWVRVKLHHPTLQPVRIDLLVPRCVERIGEIDALAIAADLNHLWTAVERLSGLTGMGRTAHDTAEMDRACLFGVSRVRNVVLDELPGPPARNIEEAVVER